MTIRKQCREVAEYVQRLMRVSQPDSAVGRTLTDWLRDYGATFGLDFEACATVRSTRAAKRRDDSKALSRASWQKLTRAVARSTGKLEQGPLAGHADILGNALGLTPFDIAIFAFVALARGDAAFRRLCGELVATRLLLANELPAHCLNADKDDIERALSDGLLATMGLVESNSYKLDEFHFYLPYKIMRVLRVPGADLPAMERALLGRPATPQLAWEDFGHVGEGRELVARLLQNAVASRRSGINVLIYGAPGTGKTELAKAIARKAGFDLYAICEADDDNDEPNRYDRLSALRLNDRLLRGRGAACLLFDEMEDILQNGDTSYVEGRRIRSAGSKVYFNRLLERNAVPVVWITNSIEEFDRAFLRRMSMVLEMKVPSRNVRAAQWVRIGTDNAFPVTEDAAAALAEKHAIPPGLARNAIIAAGIAEAPAEELDFLVGNLSKAVTGNSPRNQRARLNAPDGDLFNADRDLAAMESALAGTNSMEDISFCFYGPPGTGKSIYARRLAERMRIGTSEMRGSDLLSKWVGETEKHIAHAFESAVDEHKFLIIDEVESLLWDRRSSTHSWESSMVNEFLTSLEHHPLPFACTTNHLEQIDPAILRRFTFKIKFDALRPDQLRAAFARFFGVTAPASISELKGLTLGDFATVEKQIRFMDAPQRSAEMLTTLLETEVQAKLQSARRMGF